MRKPLAHLTVGSFFVRKKSSGAGKSLLNWYRCAGRQQYFISLSFVRTTHEHATGQTLVPTIGQAHWPAPTNTGWKQSLHQAHQLNTPFSSLSFRATTRNLLFSLWQAASTRTHRVLSRLYGQLMSCPYVQAGTLAYPYEKRAMSRSKKPLTLQ